MQNASLHIHEVVLRFTFDGRTDEHEVTIDLKQPSRQGSVPPIDRIVFDVGEGEARDFVKIFPGPCGHLVDPRTGEVKPAEPYQPEWLSGPKPTTREAKNGSARGAAIHEVDCTWITIR